MDALPTASPQEVTKSVTQPSNDLTEALTLLTNIRDGGTLKTAADALGLSLSTAYRRLRLIEEDESGVVKLLRANELKLVDNWMDAAKNAAVKGDHRPAKDALLHAKAIEPLADTNQGIRLAICIGTPEQPINITPPQVLGTQVVSE